MARGLEEGDKVTYRDEVFIFKRYRYSDSYNDLCRLHCSSDHPLDDCANETQLINSDEVTLAKIIYLGGE